VTGFVFRLIPPRPDFASTMSDDERAIRTEQAEAIRDKDPTMTSSSGFLTEIAPMQRLVSPAGSFDA
jgi:hypothetical protein